MEMKLYELIFSPKGLEKGKFLGTVSLVNGETRINVADIEFEKKLRDLFSKPIDAYYGDPTGIRMVTYIKEIEPNTPEFFKEVFFELRNVWHIYPELEE